MAQQLVCDKDHGAVCEAVEELAVLEHECNAAERVQACRQALCVRLVQRVCERPAQRAKHRLRRLARAQHGERRHRALGQQHRAAVAQQRHQQPACALVLGRSLLVEALGRSARQDLEQ